MNDFSPQPANSLVRDRRIDRACDEFETAWLAGQCPQIDEFLARVAEEDRTELARELIPLELHHRRLRDEALSPQVTSPAALRSVGTCEVREEIARGGMGVVFKGRDSELRRDVAVKVLLDRHQGEAELTRRFVEEAQISGQLQHPGIAPVYALGDSGGRPYFTMKLVKGETLAKLLAARANPAEDRARFLKIFEQVCQTLAYAHSRGVIHRDLKPANIMVGAFGEVQVMDWGLAKVLAEGESPPTPRPDVSEIRTARSDDSGGPAGTSSQTQFGSVLGTLAYMPPEQALGEINQLDQRADVFGLGAILCEILTGQPPYVAASFELLRRQAVRAELTEAFERLDRCGADEELRRLARQALSAEPASRQTDAGVLAWQIVAYREGVESRLRQAELAEAQAVTRAVAERSRRRLALILSGALLTVLAVGVIGTTWGLVRENKAKESLRRELYVADLQLANHMWESENGTAKNVATLLAGHVPVRGQTDLREFAWRLQWTELYRNSLTLKGHERGARLCAFLPEGRLATLDGKDVLRLWKLPEGTKMSESKLPEAEEISCWTISANGRTVAWEAGGRVRVFDTQTGSRPCSLTGQALGFSLSRDGEKLAAAWNDGRVQIWDLAADALSASLVVSHPDKIDALERIELAPDGNSVYLLGYPEHNRVTCLTGQQELLCKIGHESTVFSIALTADGKWLATGDANGDVRLSEAARPEAKGSLISAHRGIVSTLGFSDDGGKLVTGGADGVATIWEVAGRTRLHSFKGHLGRIRAVSFSTDGLTVASASDDGVTRVWDLHEANSPRVLGVHEHPVFSLAYSPDGTRLAVGTGSTTKSPGGIVKVWDVPSGKFVTTFWAADNRVLAIAYDGETRLVTGGYDSKLGIWNAEDGSEIEIKPGRNDDDLDGFRESSLGTLAVSPKGDFVAAGFGHPTFHDDDYEQVAKVWNLSSGGDPINLTGHNNTICDVAFSRDGRWLATASDDGLVKLWSVGPWRVTNSFGDGTDRFKSVSLSPDGKWIAVGDAKGVVTIWETSGGRLVSQLRGHADAVYRLTFSPDGRTLATASWDNTVKLWDPVIGRETRTLRGHRKWISCLAFSPDGNTLATGSYDATVRLWQAASADEIEKELAK